MAILRIRCLARCERLQGDACEGCAVQTVRFGTGGAGVRQVG